MASNGKNSVTKAQAENHRRLLQQLLRHDDNRRCADCMARGPTWASVNLGLFVCLNCSGVHRSLGTDLSKVRSTTLDTWLPEQVAFVQKMGNRKANIFWEGKLPRNFKRPPEGDMSSLRIFINDKYRDRIYALRTWDKPPTIETYLVHPFMKQIDDGSSTETGMVEVEDEASHRRPSQSSAESSAWNRNQNTPDNVSRKATQGAVDLGNVRAPETAQRLSSTTRQAPSPGFPPPPAPPRQTAAPPTTPQLFDLLSLNEPESAPSPSVQDVLLPGSLPSPSTTPAPGHRAAVSQESFPDTSSDGGWAAFVDGSAPPAAAAADDHWDAFQTGVGESNSAADPFGASESAATPAVKAAAFQPKFPSAPSSPSPEHHKEGRKPTHHRPQKSAEEIMRMFDHPHQQAAQENLFNAKAAQANLFNAKAAQANLFNANFPPPPPGGSFPGALPGMEGLGMPGNLWVPAFHMPPGTPSHADLTFPPQMFDVRNGLPPSLPNPQLGDLQGGWPSMPSMADSSVGGSAKSSKSML